MSAPLTTIQCGRDHTDDTSCILDGGENDACEVLHLLVSIISNEMHEHFRRQQSAALRFQPALQDVLGFSWRNKNPKTAGPFEDTSEMPGTPPGRAGRQLTQQGCKKRIALLTVQPEIETAGAAAAVLADTFCTAEPSASDLSASQALRASATFNEGCPAQERAGEGDTPGNRSVSRGASPAHVCVRNAEQAEPILEAWQACRSPLEISQAQEVACSVCQRHTSTTISAAVALPLVLPCVKVCPVDTPVPMKMLLLFDDIQYLVQRVLLQTIDVRDQRQRKHSLISWQSSLGADQLLRHRSSCPKHMSSAVLDAGSAW